MNLFGSSNKKKSITNNLGTDASYDGNQGNINYGSGDITVTDHGAVNSAIASNTSVSQAALLANNENVKSVLNFAGNANTKSLDFARHSVESTANAFKDNLGFLKEVKESLFSNSETATKNSMSIMNQTLKSTASGQNDFMIRVGAGLAFTVLAIVFMNSRKK